MEATGPEITCINEVSRVKVSKHDDMKDPRLKAPVFIAAASVGPVILACIRIEIHFIENF